MRIGHGYDVHRITEGRRLVLCGVEIPWDGRGLLGHSDADAAAHALMDAILGAAAMGDIGQMFPDHDPKYEGADSMLLLEAVMRRAEAAGYALGNCDITILAQRPKLMPYIPQMRKALAQRLHTRIENVSVKATTEEGLGFTGSGEGIAAHAVVLLEERARIQKL